MRKNVETIIEPREKITWISEDGLTFENEEECRQWEDNYIDNINRCFKNIVKICMNPDDIGCPIGDGGGSSYVVIPDEPCAIVILNIILKTFHCDFNHGIGFSNNDIGKKIVIAFGGAYYNYDKILDSEWIKVEYFDDLKKRVVNGWKFVEDAFREK